MNSTIYAQLQELAQLLEANDVLTVCAFLTTHQELLMITELRQVIITLLEEILAGYSDPPSMEGVHWRNHWFSHHCYDLLCHYYQQLTISSISMDLTAQEQSRRLRSPGDHAEGDPEASGSPSASSLRELSHQDSPNPLYHPQPRKRLAAAEDPAPMRSKRPALEIQ